MMWKRVWAARLALFLAMVATIFVAVVAVVMQLWNWLIPGLFAARPIDFWQAAGLLVLARLLVGRVRGPWGRGVHWGWRSRMRERWNSMSEDDRERFRRGMGGRCGHAAGPGPATGA